MAQEGRDAGGVKMMYRDTEVGESKTSTDPPVKAARWPLKGPGLQQ